MKNRMKSFAVRGYKTPGRNRREVRGLYFNAPMSRINRLDHEAAFLRTMFQAVAQRLRRAKG